MQQVFISLSPQASSNGGYSPKLYVDGANGVGAGKLKAMLASGFLGDSLDVTIVNDGTASDDVLNHQCGADFVKVTFASQLFGNYGLSQHATSSSG